MTSHTLTCASYSCIEGLECALRWTGDVDSGLSVVVAGLGYVLRVKFSALRWSSLKFLVFVAAPEAQKILAGEASLPTYIILLMATLYTVNSGLVASQSPLW